jgi:tetratricopeptide (TPR) repeat protein
MTQSTRNPDQAFGGVPPKKPSGDPARGQPSGGNAQAWYLEQANRGQLLLEQGHIERAQGVFEATLAGLGEEPSYARAVITERLGRCHLMGGQPVSAAGSFQQALEVTKKIPLTDGVKGLQCTLQSGLGDALRASGQLADARKAYEAALAIAKSLKDRRAQGVDLDHLGTLALTEGRLEDALAHYQAALDHFQELRDRASEAVTRQHLGRVLQEGRRREEAERNYREAARIREEIEDYAGAAQAWAQQATDSEIGGRSEAAEEGHRKAVGAARQTRNPVLLRRLLCGLANRRKPARNRTGSPHRGPAAPGRGVGRALH